MATLLINPYPPGPRQGILLNPSPAASPAYQPASLPALVPSNSSLSSSASSSGPGDASDYFSPPKSSSPPPDTSKVSSPRQDNAHPSDPSSKPRNGSNHSTVRRIRFAPLPEPRRDDDEDMLPPVFVEDDSDAHNEPQLTMFSALAAASISLAASPDSDLLKRCTSVSTSVPSSPCATRRPLPGDSLLLDGSCPPSSSESSDPLPESQFAAAQPDCGPDWDVIPPTPLAHQLAHHQSVPLLQPPRKKGFLKMLTRLTRSRSSQSPIARTFSPAETDAINGTADAQRGRSALLLAVGGSRSSSVSREGSLTRRESDFGTPLLRWTSEGAPGAGLPISKKKRHSLFGGSSGSGVPLGRTQSLTSLSSKDDKKAAAAKAQAASAMSTGSRGRKQTRLLNGRVYGAKRNPPANPFANARPAEPEFVEWGYGGMGSVKNSAGQNPMWARLQAGDDASGLKAADEDDGSGMGWVKRRREQREREAKERAEREKAEAEAKSRTESEGEDDGGADTETTKVEDSEKESEDQKLGESVTDEEEQKDDNSTIVEVPPAQSAPAPADDATSAPSTPQQIEHITQAVTIPAPSAHHHPRHHHSHSLGHSHSTHSGHQPTHTHRPSLNLPFVDRRDSNETARGIPIVSSSTVEEVSSTPPSSRLRTEVSADSAEQASVSSSGASTTSDDAEDGDSEDSPKDTEGGFGQDEDTDEEDEEVETSRRTALGAGVEKIARHHKEEHSSGGTPAAEVPS